MCQSFKNEITKSLSYSLSEYQTNDSTSESDHFPLSVVEEDHVIRSRSELSKKTTQGSRHFIFISIKALQALHDAPPLRLHKRSDRSISLHVVRSCYIFVPSFAKLS